MIINMITVFSLKSERKNAKSEYRSVRCSVAPEYPILKQKFNMEDLWDLRDWLQRTPYKIYYLSAFNGGFYIGTDKNHYSIESILQRVYIYMEYMNGEKFDIVDIDRLFKDIRN